MLVTVTWTIQIISALLLIVLILLHSPKGDGIAAIGGASQMFASQKSAEKGLNKVTGIIAAVFIICTFLLGFGIIISSLTTKYRDLAVLVTFGVQLWMYATPIVYPISQIPAKWQSIMLLNPMAPIVETFRYAFLGSGTIPWFYLGISVVTTLVVLFIGIILFNKVQKTFMDTI